MGKSVREQFRLMVEKYGKLPTDKANQYIERLQRQQRYISELWS
jgi:sulfite reductase alpha subunit-like flavoprotein